MIGATDVFVSYKAEDRARLRPLVAALEAEGFTVWWDTHIGGGSPLARGYPGTSGRGEMRHRRVEQAFRRHRRRLRSRRGQPRPEARRLYARSPRSRRTAARVRRGPGHFAQRLERGPWRRAFSRHRRGGPSTHCRSKTLRDVDLGHHGPAVSRRSLVVGSAGAATAVLATGGWFLLKSTSANAKRIAVLPFDNFSSDANQAYFSEGIAEELRSALTRIGLQVIGRVVVRSGQGSRHKDHRIEARRREHLDGKRSPILRRGADRRTAGGRERRRSAVGADVRPRSG